MTAMGDAVLFDALGRKGAGSVPQVLPIVPNLQGFMREAVEHGMLGAGLRRAWRVGPLALTGLGLRGLTRLPLLARRDFAAMLRSFIELELADFTRYHPPLVFLQAQLTDLALAMRNPGVLAAFAEAVRNRTGGRPALCTQNFGALTGALKSWGLEIDAILTPWNAEGEGMRPTPDACHHAARALDCPVWADHTGRLTPPTADDRAALQRGGIVGVARDDAALWSDL
jgi:hypothetical protein